MSLPVPLVVEICQRDPTLINVSHTHSKVYVNPPLVQSNTRYHAVVHANTRYHVNLSNLYRELDASVLFRLVHSLDPDVGTRICVIPFGCLLCFQWGDTTVYLTQSQLIMSCVTVLVLVYIYLG